MNNKIKVGVIGSGHLGKIHTKLWKQVNDAELTGVYDINTETAQNLADEHGIINYKSIEDIISFNDAIDIVTPTSTHFEIAVQSIKNNKHCFIEKPVTANSLEAEELYILEKNSKVIIQIGHVERYNPAFTGAVKYNPAPMFIESHRLSQFSPRATDVSVILDLMIHDIDLVVNLVKSPLKEIRASGVSVLSNEIDIANARLEFENNCVANLTSSRISNTPLRKMRLFAQDSYISMDFIQPSIEVFRMTNGFDLDKTNIITSIAGANGTKDIFYEKPEIDKVNAILMELNSFINSIKNNTPSEVTLNEGKYNLFVAESILSKIAETNLNK